MDKYLIGTTESTLSGQDFRIVEAENQDEALWLFAKRFGCRETYFLEELSRVGPGETFADRFWGNYNAGSWRDLSSSKREHEISIFEQNVREFFGVDSEFGQIYIDACRMGRATENWIIQPDFPQDMLAHCWLASFGKDMTVLSLAEIEAWDTPCY